MVFSTPAVIDPIGDGFAHLWIGQVLIAGIHRQDIKAAGRNALDHIVALAFEGLQISGRQRAGNIDIAAIKHQTLNLAFRNMAHDNATHFRRASNIVRIGVQDHHFVRRPAAQRERAGTGRVCPQPLIAIVIIDDVLLHLDAVYGARNNDGQAIEQQLGRHLVGQIDAQRPVVDRLDEGRDVIAVVSDTCEIGSGRLIELQEARQRINEIIGRHRISGGELCLTKLEGDAFVVSRPAFGQLRNDLAIDIRRNQAIIKIGHDLEGLGFSRLLRVQREDLRQRGADDQLILGGGRMTDRGGERQDAKRNADKHMSRKRLHRNSSLV
jgi:hypothetical protein